MNAKERREIEAFLRDLAKVHEAHGFDLYGEGEIVNVKSRLIVGSVSVHHSEDGLRARLDPFHRIDETVQPVEVTVDYSPVPF